MNKKDQRRLLETSVKKDFKKTQPSNELLREEETKGGKEESTSSGGRPRYLCLGGRGGLE